MTKFELEEYHRNISRDELIADLKRVALKLKKTAVTKADYNKHGKFHSSTICSKLGSWFEALKEAGLEKTRNLNIKEENLIADLIRVASLLKKDKLTEIEYNEHGNFDSSTFHKRFGSWFKALGKAGLKKTRNLGITEEEYFKNLEEVWTKLGRQPHYKDMQKPLSKYAANAYSYRFGT
jgi:metal-dependent HD superfamily phosphatase/phosphodiesterase